MHRLWSIQSDGDELEPSTGGSPKRWAAPVYDPSSNPTARGRPPAHSGPTAYSKKIAADAGSSVEDSHRRFSRPSQPKPAGDGADQRSPGTAGYSSITKSSIIFNEIETGELGAVLRRLRDALARRGLKGWLLLSERAQQLDHRRNGGVLRLDWQRLNRGLG